MAHYLKSILIRGTYLDQAFPYFEMTRVFLRIGQGKRCSCGIFESFPFKSKIWGESMGGEYISATFTPYIYYDFGMKRGFESCLALFLFAAEALIY